MSYLRWVTLFLSRFKEFSHRKYYAQTFEKQTNKAIVTPVRIDFWFSSHQLHVNFTMSQGQI
jgi:hypothetical protein